MIVWFHRDLQSGQHLAATRLAVCNTPPPPPEAVVSVIGLQSPGVEAFKSIERLNGYIRMEKCSKRARSEPVWLPEFLGWNGTCQRVVKVTKRKVEEAETRRLRLSSTALAPEQESEPNRQLQKKLAVGIHPC